MPERTVRATVAQADKAAALTALRDAARDAGLTAFPCADDPETWQSDNWLDRQVAAGVCLGHCPQQVRRACLAYARTDPVERHGVWAGRVLGPRPIPELPQCGECGRPLRTSHQRAGERPGTVTHGGNGVCTGCRDAARRATSQQAA